MLTGGGKGGVYFLFNGLLILLYCLHWFWFYHIMSMAFKLVYSGKVVKDARSESEGSDATDDEEDHNDNNAAPASSSARSTGDAPLGNAGELPASKSNGVSLSLNGISKDALIHHRTRNMDDPKDKY